MGTATLLYRHWTFQNDDHHRYTKRLERMTNIRSSPGQSPSVVREVAPLIVLALGILGGLIWSGVGGGNFATAPPYVLFQTLLMVIGFTLAARGAPRWSYPWLAFGIVGTNALLGVLISSDDEPSIGMFAIGLVFGPALGALLASLIAARSWGDAIAFLSLVLVGVNLSLLAAGVPGAASAGDAAPLIGGPLLVILLTMLGVPAGSAILAWNRGFTGLALLLLMSVLIASTLVFAFAIDRSPNQGLQDTSIANVLTSFLSGYLMIGLFTFGVGSIRRNFAGRGIVASRPSSGSESGRSAATAPQTSAEASPVLPAPAARDAEDAKKNPRPRRRARLDRPRGRPSRRPKRG